MLVSSKTQETSMLEKEMDAKQDHMKSQTFLFHTPT